MPLPLFVFFDAAIQRMQTTIAVPILLAQRDASLL
jgi:hypothetical protein